MHTYIRNGTSDIRAASWMEEGYDADIHSRSNTLKTQIEEDLDKDRVRCGVCVLNLTPQNSYRNIGFGKSKLGWSLQQLEYLPQDCS